MCSFKSIYFVLFYLVLNNANAQISDKRLCVDADCSVPVSYAKTLLRYSSPDSRILSFGPNEDVTIYSKHAGSDTNLWGAEINGKRGYIPKLHVREYRILNKPQIIVNTELVKEEQKIEPDTVKEEFEVVDGTTIYLSPQDIKPTARDDGVQATAVSGEGASEQGSSEVTETPPIETEQTTEAEKREAASDENNNVATSEENKEATENSVVDNVFSTLSNWMNDENKEGSEEDEDDEDDGEVEDEEDDEEVEDDEEPDDEQTEKEENIVSNKDLDTTLDDGKIEDKNIDSKEHEAYAEDQQEANSKENETSKEDLHFQELNDTSAPEIVSQPPEVLNILNQGVNVASYSGNLEDPVIKNDSPSSPETVQEDKKEESASKEELSSIDTSTQPKDEIIEEASVKSEEVKEFEVKKSEPLQPEVLKQDEKEKEEVGLNLEAKSDTPIPNLNTENKEKDVASDEVKEEIVKPEQVELNSEEIKEEIVKPEEVTQDGVTEVPSSSVPIPDFSAVPEPVTEASISQDDPLLNNAFEAVTPDPLSIEKGPPTNEIKEEPIAPQFSFFGGSQSADNSKEVPKEEQIIPAHPSFSLFGNSQQEPPKEAEKQVKEVTSNEDKIRPEILENLTPEAFGISTDLPESITKDVDMEVRPKTDTQTPTPVTEVIIDLNKIEDTSPIFVDKVVGADYHSNSNKQEDEASGLFSRVYEFFSTTREINIDDDSDVPLLPELSEGMLPSKSNRNDADYCYGDTCNEPKKPTDNESDGFLNFNADVLIYLTTTAVSVIVFLFGYIAMDKNKRETPLVARINKLEKQLLITLKENEMLQEQGNNIQVIESTNSVPNELVDELNQKLAEMGNDKLALEEQVKTLEEQVQALEKELDTSTEVGMELNRIVSEMLNSSNGSETLKANVEQLQRQLVEQQDTINTINESLSLKETENIELGLELDITNKKVLGLQAELEKNIEKILKIEEERDLQQNTLEGEITLYQQKHKDVLLQVEQLNVELQSLKNQLAESNRNAELKTKEYAVLKATLDQIKSVKKDELKSILDTTSVKAEMLQLKADNAELADKLSHEEVAKINLEKKVAVTLKECESLRKKYELADKEKLEINTKLDVLNNYFKEREAQLLKDINKYEAIWAAKEGEATSSNERIKYIQEELQNYKSQNEALKQEIVNQEVDLKSQISLLEKKIHENWVAARQQERKLEDAKQEAAQLRNRLTLRERNLNEEKAQNRIQSPLEMNGHAMSPPPHQSPASPPLIFGGNARDHLTKSPPIPPPGMPFLPPPPGAPFMPPPMPGMPPFMPPPPPPHSMFPDRRPPPLGRMSSPPPLNSRYSPESTVYSGYDRNSPSPTYEDSEYGASPPTRGAFSPYNERREYKRQGPQHNGRNAKGVSSGSDHSHESLGKSNRKHSKV
ncbi:transport and Golgi organization protein 1 isoform X2 [Aethina tumida]|uniref:transport and Golgi organization protein 1 isoform X2 n=1 Tax=Aethina tumida TaxID=116153 RepID=UPI002147897E|nr:transport and Golgi organization protein 1 isoform X2 [Aethina tumida]